MGRKPPVSPSLTTKFPSESVKTWDNPSKISGHEKTPETLIFRGFLHVRWSRSALAELRSAAGGLETVLRELFGTLWAFNVWEASHTFIEAIEAIHKKRRIISIKNAIIEFIDI